MSDQIFELADGLLSDCAVPTAEAVRKLRDVNIFELIACSSPACRQILQAMRERSAHLLLYRSSSGEWNARYSKDMWFRVRSTITPGTEFTPWHDMGNAVRPSVAEGSSCQFVQKYVEYAQLGEQSILTMDTPAKVRRLMDAARVRVTTSVP